MCCQSYILLCAVHRWQLEKHKWEGSGKDVFESVRLGGTSTNKRGWGWMLGQPELILSHISCRVRLTVVN